MTVKELIQLLKEYDENLIVQGSQGYESTPGGLFLYSTTLRYDKYGGEEKLIIEFGD